MTVDAARLRTLLKAHQASGGGLGWTHGDHTGAIETSQADGVHGRTMFVPTDDATTNAATDTEIAEARLACAAVNALPDLLTIAEAVFAIADNIPTIGTIAAFKEGYENLLAAAAAARKED